MKKLVVFSTLTGNTEKIANAIFSVIEGDKKILSIKDIHNIDIDDYDRIAIGYWVDKGDADEMTKKLISRIHLELWEPILFQNMLEAVYLKLEKLWKIMGI